MTQDPFRSLPGGRFRCRGGGYWPANWIRHPESDDTPVVVAYHLRLTLEKPEKFVLNVAADERYELFLNGCRVGRGNERGSPDRWFFESYQMALPAGAHDLAVRVWSLGKLTPHPQMSCGHGLLVCTDPTSPLLPQVATGVGPWRCLRLGGYGFFDSRLATPVMTLNLDESNQEFSLGSGEGWT
ncbi:MAG: alpha-L-rhamnosidase, partial [Verrucomicrobiota bacterium]